MRTPHLREVRKEDWVTLNQNIREINERLSQLEGFGSESMKHSITHMENNKLLYGPPKQISAQGSEFITKEYLASREAANIYVRSISSGGLSPIILSPSQPGANTVGSGGTPAESFPPFLIYGGDGNSVFTDFRPTTRMWIPVWGSSNYSSLLYNTSGSANINFSSTVTPFASCFCGVIPRFKVYQDPTTKGIKVRAKFEDVSWNMSLASYDRGPMFLGIFFYDAAVDVFARFGEWAAYTANFSDSSTDIFLSWSGFDSIVGTVDPGSAHLTPIQSKGTSPISSLEIAAEYTYQPINGSTTSFSLCQNEIYYNVNNAGWAAEGISAVPVSGYVMGEQTFVLHGVNMFVGLFGLGGTMSATITEFAIDQGILGYSF